VKAVGDRRATFARVDMPALDLIDDCVSKRDRPGVRNLYLTLCQVATIEMAAVGRVFEATRRLLMVKGSIEDSTLTKHMATLERLGLVEVERRGATHGGGLPSRYVLVDPPARETALDPETPRNEYPPVTDTGGVTDNPPVTDTPGQSIQGAGGHSMPPLRAHHNAVKKKKEEGERERARADQGSDDRELGGAQTDDERAVAAELAALLAERGQQLSARQRFSIRSALHATPDGVDAVAAAARIRKAYGPAGKAEHRTIGDISAVLVAELKQSSARRAEQPRSAVTPRRRGSSHYTPMSNAPQPWKIHEPRPLDPPDRHLLEAWKQARAAIEQSASRRGSEYAWKALLEPLGLAGVYVTPVSEAGHADQEQTVIVLDAPLEVVGQVAEHRHMRAMVTALEHELGEEGIMVELARRDHAAAGAAAA
jgi:DNA-binding transcriptional ArsR family regulator